MHKRFNHKILLLALAGLIGLGATAEAQDDQQQEGKAEQKQSLLKNGDLKELTGEGTPIGWKLGENATFKTEDGVGFIRITSPEAGKMVTLYQRVNLPKPAPYALQIRLKARAVDVKHGAQKWNDARVIGHFKNDAGRTLKPEPSTPSFLGTSPTWVEKNYFVKVPATATYLELLPCLLNAASGSFDVAECSVLPATRDEIRASKPAIIPSETIIPPADAKLPPQLKVVGKDLLTDDDKPFWLQGVCIDSLEWSAGGEKIEQSIPVAMESWKSNVVRLPVREDFWFGRGPWQKKESGGKAYRELVDRAVEAVASRGGYLVLDLHRFRAPTEDHVDFWLDAAVRYKNHPAVIFELFNEPHDISWEVWRDGGLITDKEGPNGQTTVGMQALLDAVRSTGARNVVVVGGLDWSYDLSGIVNGYALKDTADGRGIVYSSHIYPWKTDWKNKVLACAAQHPIFVGEVGCPADWTGFTFIPESARIKDLDAWPADVLGLIQGHRLHWTAFSFHPKCGPPAISDWDYTPTPYWGIFAKQALTGEKFEIKKMR